MTVVCPECHSIVYPSISNGWPQAAQQEQEQTWLRRGIHGSRCLPVPAERSSNRPIQARVEENAARLKAGRAAQGHLAEATRPTGACVARVGQTEEPSSSFAEAEVPAELCVIFGVYWSLFGPWFGAGLRAKILIHEAGARLRVKRQGLKADLPVFLPGFGAYVRWQGFNISMIGVRRSRSPDHCPDSRRCRLHGVYMYTQRPVFAALAHAGAVADLLNSSGGGCWTRAGGHALSRLQRGLLLYQVSSSLH